MVKTEQNPWEKKKKTKGCLLWWVIIFFAIIILGVIGGNLNDQEAQQKAQEQPTTNEQPTEAQGLKCEGIISDKVSIIYDYVACVQEVSKLTSDSLIISEFTKCSTTFMEDYYNKTVKDYDCTDAELVSIKNMDQFYTTYTNCIWNIKTDYTKDMAGAFGEVSQCHANFVTSFNNWLTK